jgi:catechol 2,3-dioxygenase-like lactoylglutathione lyase family enzyme
MSENAYPQLQQTVLDCVRVRELAEFYRALLGLRYRPGDEAPTDGAPDEADWLVLTDEHGARTLAFQQVDELPESTWPEPGVPQQLHLDLTVASRDELERQRERAVALGAGQRLDRTDDPEEPLYVFADPAGHPFCIFVA